MGGEGEEASDDDEDVFVGIDPPPSQEIPVWIRSSLQIIFNSNSNNPQKGTIEKNLQQGLDHLMSVHSSMYDSNLNQQNLSSLVASYSALAQRTPSIALQQLKKNFPKPTATRQSSSITFHDIRIDADNSVIRSAVLQLYGPVVSGLFLPFFEDMISSNLDKQECIRSRVVEKLRHVFNQTGG